ncbi:MAG: excinuclease ABC subunit B, partial [Gemmatimonadetes bacterium]
EFDVLVGINLLREGLDLPEVSLVAILDADQEGFLRSDRSLIQTVGRAARHLQGRAILYADRVTGSMQRALDEMTRRREAQVAYNAQHGITPRSIVKSVDQVRFATRFADAKTARPAEGGVPRPADAKERDALIKLLESQMQAAAEELDFELAAVLRDQILELRAEADTGRHAPVRGRAPAVR